MSISDDYKSEMHDFDGYTDDEIEAILSGLDVADEDSPIARFVAEARSIATESIDADVVRRHVPMLAEAARHASAEAQRALTEADRANRALTTGRFAVRKRRLVAKAGAFGLAAVLMGGSVASAATGNLPGSAQEAMADLAAQIGIDLPRSAREIPDKAVATQAIVFTTPVPAIEFMSALKAWNACVAGNASERGTTQRDPETRVEGPFDPTAGCDPKPELDAGESTDFAPTGPKSGPGASEGAGPPAGTGPPAEPGPPPDAGPPPGVGPPADSGPPPDAGPPADSGPPADAGPPADPGPPPSAGPPADQPTGQPQDGGPPAGHP